MVFVDNLSLKIEFDRLFHRPIDELKNISFHLFEHFLFEQNPKTI